MPVFRYKAVAAKSGEILHGTMEAPSKTVAIAKLQSAGHLPISADEVGQQKRFDLHGLSQWLQRDTVSKKDIVLFTRELATLIQAGLPLDTALRTLSRLNLPAAMENLIGAILEKIQGGVSLSDALAEHEQQFDRIYINMVRAGEASGAMGVVITRLAEYLERMSELRSYVISAMIYPAILFCFCIASLLVLMTFVVPRFVPLFEGVEQSLPLMTQFVFSASALFQQYWWLLLIVFTTSIVIADKQLAKPDVRLRFDGWLLHLPYLGSLLQEMEIARFARTLSTAIANGVPLLSGIRLIKDVINNRVINNVMDGVIASLEQGQSMAKPLRDSRVCPDLAVQLIEIGEESGQLDSMLVKVADIYDQQVQTTIRRILTILEPAMILGLGGLIAFIILSILLAILGLNELVV